MKTRIETHERLTADRPIIGISDYAFGVFFTIVFTVIGLFPLLDSEPRRGWSLAVAGVVLVVTLFKAEVLAPFNKVWFRFGLILHGIVNPIVLVVLYYAVVTPTGLVMRALGKDLLHLRYDPNAESYWIHRDPRGLESMKNQF